MNKTRVVVVDDSALVRGLPKDVRRQLGPAPNVATAALARMDPSGGPLVEQLQRAIRAAAAGGDLPF